MKNGDVGRMQRTELQISDNKTDDRKRKVLLLLVILVSLLPLVIYNAVLCMCPMPPLFVLHVQFQRHLRLFTALIILGWDKVNVAIKKFRKFSL